ncbi:MAG TPA: hypothetical protein VEA69_01010 [Tepidisphaeraceae bacterium]|nr:hypothetical protein [Tepidisphaeraceae bacterium]
MKLVPEDDAGAIGFFASRSALWSTNAVGMGSTAPIITSMNAKTALAQQKLTDAITARNQAKTATEALRIAVRDMRGSGSEVIRQVRTKAAVDHSDTPYLLADLPTPPIPGPTPNPGTPTNFKVVLNPDGSIKATWKCANPKGSSGTMYLLWRKVGSAEFVSIGGSGTKSFVDNTLPAGVPSVTYRIQAVRSTAVGEAAQFVVNFGVGGGTMTAAVVSAPKLAA